MKLGCFQSNKGLQELDFRTFVQKAADLGYQAIDVPATDPAAAAPCRSLGLTVHSAGPVFLPDLAAQTDRQEAIAAQMTAAIDSAAAQQIATITTLIGRAPGLSGDENIALFRDVFTPLAARAEAQKVQIAFENWPRNGTMLATTPELWDAMFNAVPSPALGLCYDPSHFYWQGIDYIQPIWDFRDRIYHAHAKDTEILLDGRNRFGIYGRQLSATTRQNWWHYRLPGYGHVDWYRYLDTLYQVGYDAVLSVEHEDPVWSQTPDLALRGLQLARQFLAPLLA
jgi:sugar phosphate isomerase/epimerase